MSSTTQSVAASATRVVCYVRVSTSRQAESGLSLDAQRHRLSAYCEAMGLDCVAVLADEGLSARSLARPALQQALAMLDAGEADGLLVTKLDRLTRSVRDLGDLVERFFASRCSLLSVADSIDTRSAGGRLVLNVLMSVAQWEREAASERVTEALAQAKREGVQLGGVATGQRRSTRKDERGRRVIEADAAQQRAVARIAQLRGEGQSLRAIASTLQAEGHRPQRGDTWHASTVRNVLRRAA